jgi:CRISPR system Cascade subunit CasE
MSLSMLQMSPDVEHLIRWAHSQRVLRAREDDLGYVLHAILRAAFGPALAPKPFAWVAPPRRAPRLLAYSAEAPEALREHAAAFAEPDVHRALGLDQMAAKSMPATFAPGRRLGFSIRVRPMLRTDRDGDRDRSREIDAFLASALREPENRTLSRGEIYAAWLADRMRQGGAEPEQTTLTAYRRTRVIRRGREDEGRAFRSQEGPDVTFEGLLSVTEPRAFTALLARGVGRHRAFGFGMLLLRPA